MFDEKSSERNKKRREGDTTDQTDENSDWLHMHSTYSNGATINKSIYWCGDYNYCGDTLAYCKDQFVLYGLITIYYV
jgi:hypothetical protein